MKLFKKQEYRKFFYPPISIALILFTWWVLSASGTINPLFLPSLFDTFTSLARLLSDSYSYYSLSLTALRALIGLSVAIVIGVPAGLIFAKISWLYKFFELPIEFFRSVPSSALFPLFILFFGIGDYAKVGVVIYACSLIILVSSFYGALPNQEKIDRINLLRTLGANNAQIFTFTILRDALPNISSGIRVCLSYSFALVVVTEMLLGTKDGLGKMLYDYYLQYRIPEMYATIIILGLTGFTVNKLYLRLEQKFIFWAPK